MLEDTTLGAIVLANPGIVQGLILGELSDRLNGVYQIADPNCGFNVSLEASSSMVAACVG